MNVRAEDLKHLPLPQRLRLVEDLWDSIADEIAKTPISDELKAEINRRREEYLRDPATAVDWDALRHRLESRK